MVKLLPLDDRDCQRNYERSEKSSVSPGSLRGIYKPAGSAERNLECEEFCRDERPARQRTTGLGRVSEMVVSSEYSAGPTVAARRLNL
jgi:hypothetical protein